MEQSQAILKDMHLQRLTTLEGKQIHKEHRDLMERIKELRAILGNEDRLYGLIKEELAEIKQIYGDERRSEITAAEDEVRPRGPDRRGAGIAVSITRSRYIKQLPLSTYRKQKRGGVGVIGNRRRRTTTSSTSASARRTDYRLKVYELPRGGPCAREPAAAPRGRCAP